MREKLRTRWEQSALKAWADGKLPLSRGKKLVLNLVIVALAGLWLWGLADYPLPTAELEFRRMERRCMLPESELVFATPERYRARRSGRSWCCLWMEIWMCRPGTEPSSALPGP